MIGAAVAGGLLAAVAIATGARAQGITLPGIPPADFKTEVQIQAGAEQVWAVLTNFPTYSIWNPFIYPVKGEARVGTTLEITMHPGARIITYQATVVAAQPNRELAWFARSLSPGVFDMTIRFTIEPLQGNGVRLVLRETHTGFASIFEAPLVKDIQSGLDAMTKAARDRVELVRQSGGPGRQPPPSERGGAG